MSIGFKTFVDGDSLRVRLSLTGARGVTSVVGGSPTKRKIWSFGLPTPVRDSH